MNEINFYSTFVINILSLMIIVLIREVECK